MNAFKVRENIADLQENIAKTTLKDVQLPKFVQQLDEINKFYPFIMSSGLVIKSSTSVLYLSLSLMMLNLDYFVSSTFVQS
ncbi:hypothetical protein WICANDRAFT_85287 [Wickerhamomyces anomalus NRRL Y-366-8]|uniref:Uncharacterized protein n=1 Tax=Wickerhamomyces anomalus (strain ATCC 58044 / CBS 1984 / NCYC 433 / NRRL Y-366-8) TaxID=683960 RepID=A0A1E3NYL5_WICAA|nr:uncharacterized protein WICANDRAFT_85287 [Wickerhamomyces anomalus NRRL Y-366-8]ODQ58195.1 hypothetical protein WICANDRAFT_85287 [Wickerhamomyces anomalus NRRL Y-366-8]